VGKFPPPLLGRQMITSSPLMTPFSQEKEWDFFSIEEFPFPDAKNPLSFFPPPSETFLSLLRREWKKEDVFLLGRKVEFPPLYSKHARIRPFPRAAFPMKLLF